MQWRLLAKTQNQIVENGRIQEWKIKGSKMIVFSIKRLFFHPYTLKCFTIGFLAQTPKY